MKSINELRTDAEMALMGFTVDVDSKESLAVMLDIIRGAVQCTDTTSIEIVEKAFKYTKKGVPVYLTVSTLMGFMRCVTIVIQDGKDKPVLDDENGVLSYVYNFTAPDCSELGYTFFQKKMNKGYVRVS